MIHIPFASDIITLVFLLKVKYECIFYKILELQIIWVSFPSYSLDFFLIDTIMQLIDIVWISVPVGRVLHTMLLLL